MDTSFAFLTTRYDNSPDTMHPFSRHTVYLDICSARCLVASLQIFRTGSSAIPPDRWRAPGTKGSHVYAVDMSQAYTGALFDIWAFGQELS